MKLTIKKLGTLLLCGALMIGTGCSDFLEEEDPSNIAPETFFTLPEHAEMAVYGIYENLRFHSGGAGIFVSNFQMLDALSGTAESETGQNSDLNNFYNFDYTGDNLLLKQWWQELYEGIGNANLAITKIPGIPNMIPAAQTKWLGQAKFMRALHYFYLVRLWGGVPLITQPINSFKDPLVTPPRATAQEVYDLIVADLLAAEAAGFAVTDATGLASRMAVKSLLAEVYLTMAGSPLNKGAAYYQLAADKAKEVIDYANANPTIIGLFPSYNDIHDPSKRNTIEHLLGIQYATGIANAGYQDKFLPNNQNITASGEVGTTVPLASFTSTYEAGDKRMNEKAFYFKQYVNSAGVTVTYGKYYIYKHYDAPANGTLGTGAGGSGNSGLNYPLIRYAQVLLTYAEAKNEVAAGDLTAIAALKLVRDRAGLVTAATYTQSALKDLVLAERWHELSYENITWFDIIRTKKVYTGGTSFANFEGATLNGKVLTSKLLLLPLPGPDFRNNPNIGANNPGW